MGDLGQEVEVLVEGPSDEIPGQFTGLTRTNKTVNFLADESRVGQLVPVRTTSAHQWGFIGEMASP